MAAERRGGGGERRRPILSVVVCTHNRPRDLSRCLEAIARLEDDVELIVVDSASSPPVRDVVEEARPRLPRLRYAYEPVPGLSRARNVGLGLASLPLVAFVDDDAAPRPDWARRIVAPFADAAVACVGGACAPVFESPRPRWLSPRLLQYAGITTFGPPPRVPRSTREWPIGANICFRADDVSAVGGFPERLGRIGTVLLSGEESRVVEAIDRRGRLVWIEPDAVVDHTVHAEQCRTAYYVRLFWWIGITRARAAGSVRLTARLLAAVPARLALWAYTRDRVHVLRTLETAGYLAACARLAGRAGGGA